MLLKLFWIAAGLLVAAATVAVAVFGPPGHDLWAAPIFGVPGGLLLATVPWHPTPHVL